MKAYPRETTEAFLDGHVSAFGFFGGVPHSILYDNTRIALARICGDGRRERTRAFTELVSHYLFPGLVRPARARGNDKGEGRGAGEVCRSNFLTPIPVAASFAELNVMLARALPPAAGRAGLVAMRRRSANGSWPILRLCAPCRQCRWSRARSAAGVVSSTALVRYRSNDCSVPTAYGFQDGVVKGFVEEVVVMLCRGEEIARHPRSYGTGVFVADPLHYLALIEVRPNALDQAAALQGWDLPESFQHLRHLLEARMGNRGKREVHPGYCG